MPIEFEIMEDVSSEIARQRSDFEEFSHLRAHEIEIRSCVKINLDRDMEPKPTKGHAVHLIKVAPLIKAFITIDYVVVVDHYFWVHADTRKRQSAIHGALMQIDIVETRNSVKKSKRKPEIVEFRKTLMRFGPSETIQDLIPLLVESGSQVAATIALAAQR